LLDDKEFVSSISSLLNMQSLYLFSVYYTYTLAGTVVEEHSSLVLSRVILPWRNRALTSSVKTISAK